MGYVSFSGSTVLFDPTVYECAELLPIHLRFLWNTFIGPRFLCRRNTVSRFKLIKISLDFMRFSSFHLPKFRRKLDLSVGVIFCGWEILQHLQCSLWDGKLWFAHLASA